VEEPTYPRTYVIRKGWQIFLYVASALLAALGFAVAIMTALDDPPQTPIGSIILSLLAVAIAALGIAGVVDTRLSRIVLRAEELVIHDMRLRRVRRDELKGRRLLVANGVTQLVLEKHDGSSVNLPLIIESDAALERWIASLPDLDGIELAAAQEDLRGLLAKDVGRAGDLRLGTWSARVLNAAAALTAAWAWFYPRPYEAAVLVTAVLPLAALAVVARFRGIVSIDSPKNDPRPNVALPLILPSCVLGIRAFDYAVVDLTQMFLTGMPVAILPAVIGAWLDPTVKRRWLTASLFGALNVGYGVGGACLANGLLDASEPVVYRTQVAEKRISRGKHTSYNLRLEPWGPVLTREKVDVGRRLFDQVEEDDSVVVLLHEGALGLRWFQVALDHDSEAR
jgi:hypothetical protein